MEFEIELCPELHDLLKLLECFLLHNDPEKLDKLKDHPLFLTFKHHHKKQSDSPGYKGIIEPYIKEKNSILKKNFFLSLADTRAATITRMKEEEKNKRGEKAKLYSSLFEAPRYQVFKLWARNEPTTEKLQPQCPIITSPYLKDFPEIKCPSLECDKQENEILTCPFLIHKELLEKLIFEIDKKENNLAALFADDDVLSSLKRRAEDTAGEVPFEIGRASCRERV